jgi:hypothetical protein
MVFPGENVGVELTPKSAQIAQSRSHQNAGGGGLPAKNVDQESACTRSTKGQPNDGHSQSGAKCSHQNGKGHVASFLQRKDLER